MTTDVSVGTGLGPLRVRGHGGGPPTVLWHSLFVDDSMWQRVEAPLAESRALISITGPSHGDHSGRPQRWQLDDCATAAATILDELDVTEPVDWVGSAWGGHVGMMFASRYPQRCRSLVAMAAPTTPLAGAEKARIAALVQVYRLVGAKSFLRKAVVDGLLGRTARQYDPDARALVENTFAAADRTSLYEAMVAAMLQRPDLTPVLSGLIIPVLLIVGAEDEMWSADDARVATNSLANAHVVEIDGAGHLPPLEKPTETIAAIEQFWGEAGVR